MQWTDEKALRAQLQQWWDRGLLLATGPLGGLEFPRRMAFKTPDSKALTERFDEVRAWISALQAVRGFRIETRVIRHRVLGENRVPVAAWVDTPEAAIAILGRQREVQRFADLVSQTQERLPQLMPWVQRYPQKALGLADVWSKLLDFIVWLLAHPEPGIYLRQVSIPGIDSKFIEQHRGVLLPLLDLALPPEQIRHSEKSVSQFERRYGFSSKPLLVRFRILDPGLSLLPGRDADITLSTKDFRELDQHPVVAARIRRVFITENEINFLAFPTLAHSLVIFGAGYGFEALSDVAWLKRVRLYYWGDIDTHGFIILDQLRGKLSKVQSLLMDEPALLAHRGFWGQEGQPEQRELKYLTDSEQRLYQDLCSNRFGDHLRLEQERIRFDYLITALAGTDPGG